MWPFKSVRAQGDPEEWPLWTRRTGFVVVSLALETHVPTAGGVSLRQSYLPILDGFLNSKLAALGHAVR